MSDFIKTYAILFHKSYTAVAGLEQSYNTVLTQSWMRWESHLSDVSLLTYKKATPTQTEIADYS